MTRILFLITLPFRRNYDKVSDVPSHLSFIRNIHGDEINHRNCRSIWSDKNGNVYNCNNLFYEI